MWIVTKPFWLAVGLYGNGMTTIEYWQPIETYLKYAVSMQKQRLAISNIKQYQGWQYCYRFVITWQALLLIYLYAISTSSLLLLH